MELAGLSFLDSPGSALLFLRFLEPKALKNASLTA